MQDLNELISGWVGKAQELGGAKALFETLLCMRVQNLLCFPRKINRKFREKRRQKKQFAQNIE